MINRRIIFAFTGMLCLFASTSQAQSYVESALLFSRTIPGGSARIQAMGGSQIALGGDFSSTLSNPAGLGMYNRSEVTLSPAMSFYDTRAQYLGNEDTDSKSTFNIPGLSFVFHLPHDKNGFLGGSFGVSMSRTNDFNRSIRYHGTNEDNSIIDYFIDDADGSTTDQFDEFTGYQYNTPTGLAYFNYLIGPASIIDPAYPDDEYFTDVLTIPDQSEILESKGSSNQWSFSYGGNFKDLLFFGGGIGVTSLRYEIDKTYSESFDDPYLNGLALQESLEVRGTGINATVGAIVRPVNFVQVGVSFTTPTYYGFAETYSATMNTDWKNFDYYGDGSKILNNEEASTDIVKSDYNLTTPLKFSGGIAFLSKFGILTGDVEFVNPGQAKYSSNTSDVSFQQENEMIKSVFKSVINYRVGAEFRYNIFRVRGGYAVQGSTYEDRFDLDNSIKTISGGLGVRMKRFFVDFALVYSTGNSYYQPYSVVSGPSPIVDLENKTTTGLLTAGFNF